MNKYVDILGRDIRVDDILVYCSPIDGLHALLVTMKDIGGKLWVSRLRANYYNGSGEYFEIAELGIKDLEASRQYLPLDIFSDYIILKNCNLGLEARKLMERDANDHSPLYYLIKDDKIKIYWTLDEDVNTWYYDRLGGEIRKGEPIVYAYYNKNTGEYELNLGIPLIYDNRGVLYACKIKKFTEKYKNEVCLSRIFLNTNYIITAPLFDVQFFRQNGIFNLNGPSFQCVSAHIL